MEISGDNKFFTCSRICFIFDFKDKKCLYLLLPKIIIYIKQRKCYVEGVRQLFLFLRRPEFQMSCGCWPNNAHPLKGSMKSLS